MHFHDESKSKIKSRSKKRRSRQSAQVSHPVRAAFAVFAAFLLAACGGPRGGDESLTAKFSGGTMGTEYHVTVAGLTAPEQAEAAQKAVEAALESVNAKMSTYLPDSELSRFNRHDSTEPFPVSPETAEVFRIALEVAALSGGAFDPTVGPLVNAWGFGPDNPAAPPSEAETAALQGRVGWQKVSVGADNTLCKTRGDVYCDLSAVAKGYAVDRAAAALEALGLTRHMVEVGGEVRARGTNPGGRPWRIGVERPRPDGRAVQEVVALRDAALATSGDYRNFHEVDGVRVSHTMDPRAGRPVTHSLASASVLHEYCAWADAFATALMVLGPEEGLAFAEKNGLAVSLMIREPDGAFTIRNTPAFDAALAPMDRTAGSPQ